MSRICRLFFLLTSVFVLVSCDPKLSSTSENAFLEANKEAVRKAAVYINARDYENLRTVIADEYLRHSQATPELTVSSFDEFIGFLKGGAIPFPDDRAMFDILVAEGDLVAFWGRYEGTNTGPGPFPTTGKSVSIEMGGIHRMEDGKIAETWVIWDNMTMFSQLGIPLVPAETPQPPQD